MLLVGGGIAMAQNSAGDYTAGTTALTTVTEEIAKYVPIVVKLCYAIAGVVAVVMSFGGFFKVRMGERSVRIREVKGSNPSRSTFSSSVILTLLLFFCVHISHTLAL